MMKFPCSILAVALLLAPLTLRAADTVIVQNGQPRAQIVIAQERPRMVTLAALELQRHLQTMSGARLPIVTSPVASLPVKIYVGKSPATDKLGVTDRDLKYGAFRMVSGPDWLVLLGNDFDFVPPAYLARKRSDKTTERLGKKRSRPRRTWSGGFRFNRVSRASGFPSSSRRCWRRTTGRARPSCG